MPLGARLEVFIVFAFGLIAVPLSILHLSYVHAVTSSDDPQLTVTNTLLVQQAMLTWCILSAIIPNMKRLLNAVSMTFGVRIPLGPGKETAGQAESMNREAFALQTIGSQPARRRHTPSNSDLDGFASCAPVLPGGGVAHESIVEYTGAKSLTTDEYHGFSETSSQEMIIREDTQWRMSREPSPNDHSLYRQGTRSSDFVD